MDDTYDRRDIEYRGYNIAESDMGSAKEWGVFKGIKLVEHGFKTAYDAKSHVDSMKANDVLKIDNRLRVCILIAGILAITFTNIVTVAIFAGLSVAVYCYMKKSIDDLSRWSIRCFALRTIKGKQDSFGIYTIKKTIFVYKDRLSQDLGTIGIIFLGILARIVMNMVGGI